jgi:hypothetical protein
VQCHLPGLQLPHLAGDILKLLPELCVLFGKHSLRVDVLPLHAFAMMTSAMEIPGCGLTDDSVLAVVGHANDTAMCIRGTCTLDPPILRHCISCWSVHLSTASMAHLQGYQQLLGAAEAQAVRLDCPQLVWSQKQELLVRQLLRLCFDQIAGPG